MKYNTIIFDADDTLFDFKKSEREAFKNTMLEFNYNYDESYHLKIYHEINAAIWREFEDGLISQKELKVERFKRFSDKLELELDAESFAKAYAKHLANQSFLYEDSIALIESLSKDYNLTIVTNGLTDIQEKRIKKSPIAKYFKNIIISEEVKVSKPDPKIFEYTLIGIKYIDKSKVLMVGDSLNSDIRGGNNFGIDTCWFNQDKVMNKTDVIPTYEISNLLELKKFLWFDLN